MMYRGGEEIRVGDIFTVGEQLDSYYSWEIIKIQDTGVFYRLVGSSMVNLAAETLTLTHWVLVSRKKRPTTGFGKFMKKIEGKND